MALCAPPASARERSSMMPTAGRMRPPTEASMSVGEKPHLVTCSACVCVLCVSGYSTGTPCLASREHGIGPIRCASGWRRRSRPSEDSEPAAVRRSGSGPSTASLSRGCPVVRHVRSCPVDVRYVSGSVSGSMSDHVRKHVRKGVRKCPMLSDDVRPILDSTMCVTVRLCPVVSGRVRLCPIMYHGGLWGCPLVYNTTIAPSQRAALATGGASPEIDGLQLYIEERDKSLQPQKDCES